MTALDGPGRETFPELHEDIGEDPARYLDHELLHNGSMSETFEARVRGIDSIRVARAWIAVERRLSRKTRPGVIRRLEYRIDFLEEQGGRPISEADPTELGDRYKGRREVDPDDIPSNVRFLDENGEPRDYTSATDKLSRMRSRGKAATDGGADE